MIVSGWLYWFLSPQKCKAIPLKKKILLSFCCSYTFLAPYLPLPHSLNRVTLALCRSAGVVTCGCIDEGGTHGQVINIVCLWNLVCFCPLVNLFFFFFLWPILSIYFFFLIFDFYSVSVICTSKCIDCGSFIGHHDKLWLPCIHYSGYT